MVKTVPHSAPLALLLRRQAGTGLEAESRAPSAGGLPGGLGTAVQSVPPWDKNVRVGLS